MHYRLELRRLGVVIREFETDRKREAKETAKKWLATTLEAVLILFIDGEEIRLKDTRKALGIRAKDFDNLTRYSAKYNDADRILRHASVGVGNKGGRVPSRVLEYSDDDR